SRTRLCTFVTASARTVTAYSSGTGTDAAEKRPRAVFRRFCADAGRFIQDRRRFFTNWTVSHPKFVLPYVCAPDDSRACRSCASDCALVRAADAARRTFGPRERGA